MNTILIDLDNLIKSKIHIMYYLPLQMIIEENSKFNQFLPDDLDLKELENKGWIKINEAGEPEPRQKLLDLFPQEKGIDFDEFWNVFPVKTRSGRILRTINKMFQGKLCRDYMICKTKYLAKIKTVEAHTIAINAIEAKVDSGDIEYLNGIEVYINQNKWEIDSQLIGKNYHGKDI